MSLLLDALRRAEEAKRAKQGPGSNGELPLGSPVLKVPSTTTVPPPDFQPEALAFETPARLPEEESSPLAEPSSPTPPKGHGALDFSLAELEPAHAPFPLRMPTPAANAPASPPEAKPVSVSTEADERVQREQIKNAFSVKAKTTSGSPRKWLPVLLAVIIVMIGGGGWYVWSEIQRISRPAIAQAIRPAPPPAPSMSAPSTSTGSTTGALPVAAGSVGPEQGPALPPLLPPEPPKPTTVVTSSAPASRPLTENERIAKSIKVAAPKSEPPLSLKPSIAATARIHPGLTQAYAALQAGDLERAAAEYERVSTAEPLNLDAQLGLAAIAAKRGDRASAMRHYQQSLDIDPKNTYAIAGLLALRAESSADRQEATLRTMIAQSPDAPALHFALGNLLATQQRWQEAQQAYFDAWRSEPERADFAYNLAISLDQLKQAKLARDYYGKALNLAKSGGAQFDPAAVAKRIGELADSSP